MKRNFSSFFKKFSVLLILAISVLAVRQEMVFSASAPLSAGADIKYKIFNNSIFKGISTFKGKAVFEDTAIFKGRVGIKTDKPSTDLDVSGIIKAKKLRLGDKWLLSGVGDAHGNDDWLRLFNKDGTGYFGGIAMNKLWLNNDATIHGNIDLKGNLCIKGDCRSAWPLAGGGPQGPLGPTGPQGPPGPTGPAGPQGSAPSNVFDTIKVNGDALFMNNLDIRGIIRFHNSNTHLYGDSSNLASRPVSGDFYIQNSQGGNGRLCLSGDCRSTWPQASTANTYVRSANGASVSCDAGDIATGGGETNRNNVISTRPNVDSGTPTGWVCGNAGGTGRCFVVCLDK